MGRRLTVITGRFTREQARSHREMSASGLTRDPVFAQPMGDCRVRSLQAVGQLAGRGVADVELFQQRFFEGFDGVLQGFYLTVALPCNRGAGDVQIANVDEVAFTDGRRAKDTFCNWRTLPGQRLPSRAG